MSMKSIEINYNGSLNSFVFAFCFCMFLLLGGCSNSDATASAVLKEGSGGSDEVIEPSEKDTSLEDKSIELTSLLEEQEYIELAIVDLNNNSEDKTKICFFVTLAGDQLSEHIDEILTLVTQDTDNIDMENSYILDYTGLPLYP